MPITMEKRTQEALVSLDKVSQKAAAKGIDLGDVCAQVELAMDYSGSMGARYRRPSPQERSEVETVVDRFLGLSLTGLDDDGVVPVHFFRENPFDPVIVDQNNYLTFVEDFMRTNGMGGTNYSRTIEAILGGGAKKKRFGRSGGVDLEAEKDQPPKFIPFVTDGAPNRSDMSAIERLLVGARSRPFFFQFIMVGDDRDAAQYLTKLNTQLAGSGIDNVGLTRMISMVGKSDVEFFDDVIGEFFLKWLPAARREGITRK